MMEFDPAIQEYFKIKHFSKISVLSLNSPGSHDPEEVTDEEVNDTKQLVKRWNGLCEAHFIYLSILFTMHRISCHL